ncbi:hypothetical protein ACT7CY_29525, partial [Bacillus pacificus]
TSFSYQIWVFSRSCVPVTRVFAFIVKRFRVFVRRFTGINTVPAGIESITVIFVAGTVPVF